MLSVGGRVAESVLAAGRWDGAAASPFYEAVVPGRRVADTAADISGADLTAATSGITPESTRLGV